MAVSDAQFVFETNLPQVRKEITAELAAISTAVSQMQGGSAGGDLLSGITGKIKKDVAGAIEQIRQVHEQARQQVESGRGLQSGQQTAALQINDVLAMLYGKVESRLRQAALRAGPEAAGVDIKAMIRQLDEALFAHVRNQSRAMIREVERTGTAQAQGVFGTARQIPGRRAQTDLTTVGDLQGQVAAAKEAAKNITASQRRLQQATDDNAQAIAEQAADTKEATGQRRSRSRRLAKSEEDLAAANEQAAATTKDAARQSKVIKVDLNATQKADSKRVLKGIGSDDPNFGYANRAGTPSSTVVDRTDPNSLRFFRQSGAGYEEIAKGTSAYTTALNTYKLQLQDQAKREADAAKAQAKADADLLKAKQAYSQKIQAGLASQNANYGYITKSGDQGKYVFDDPNSLNPRISKNVGTSERPVYEELDQSSKDYANQQRRLQGILVERAQAEEQAARQAAEFAATEAEAKAALSQSIRNSLMARDGQYDYISKNGRPTKEVYTGDSRDNLKVFKQDANGDFDEITPAHKDYVAAMRRAQDAYTQHAQATQSQTKAEEAAGRALEAAKVAEAKSADIASKLARNDPSVQYLTDSGRPTSRLAEGPDGSRPTDPKTARYFQRQGSGYAEIHQFDEAGQADARFIEAQRLLTAQINDRTRAEDRARAASQRYADSQRASAAATLGPSGGGGFGGGLSRGLFSGGFGDNGDSPAFGLGRSLGQTVKYSLLYKVFNDLLTIMGQVTQEFLNVDDSITELQVSMTGSREVTTDFINSLQDIAAPGGFNVGDAMDQAAAGIRAYRQEIEKANDATGNFQNDVGNHLAAAAAKIAVIAKTTLPDAAQNTRATMLGFGLDPLTGPNQVADAVANAKLIGGGLEKDISQGGANIAEVAHSGGFSLQEALSLVGKISANTDESGTLAATRFSRIVGTLQGSAGQNYLTQLNQSLPDDKKININASARDQTLQLAAAMDVLSEAQKHQALTAIGGQAQQKEFNILMQDFPRIAKESAQAQAGLADQEYQQHLGNVRNLLGQIRGQLVAITTNVALSGTLDAFALLLKILIPILDAVRLLTGEFNRIPAVVREIGGGLAAVLLTLKGIDYLKGAGGGSIVAGVKNLATNAERVVRPEAAAARRELNGGDPFQRVVIDPAHTHREETFAAIARQENEGTLTSGAAFKARMQAEQDYKAEIRANTIQYKAEAKKGAYAVSEAGKEVATETTRTGAQGAGALREAIAQFVAAIRGGAAQVSVAGAEGAAEGAALNGVRDVVPTARGGAPVEEPTMRSGKIGGFLGRSVGTIGSGLGALLAPEVLLPLLGFAGIDAAAKLHDTANSVDDAQRTVDNTKALDVPAGADALQAAAKANETAAQSMREATGGVFGGIINYLQNGAAGRSATDATALSHAQADLADRLQAQQTQASVATGPAALASQINLSSGDTIKTSVQNLLDAGQTASGVLDALALALKNLKFAATGTVSDMSDLQKTDLAGRAGIAAGQVFGDSRDGLEGQIKNNKASGFQQILGQGPTPEDQRRSDALPGQLNALNKVGQQGITDTTTNVIGDFFKNNPTASLDDPKVMDGLKRSVIDALMKQGLDKGTAALASTRATADLGKDRAKFLADIATPDGAGALVDATIGTAQLEQQRVQSQAQLQAIRSGKPDRSATLGLKTYQSRLQTAYESLQSDVAALDAKDPTGKSSAALRLNLIKAQAALADNEAKIVQQASADAKSDIDELEKQRIKRQQAAASVAQVKAIGDSAIKDELGKAIKTMDPDLLASVITRASDDQLKAFGSFLAQKLATDAALIEAERKAEIVAGLLQPDGSPTQDRPSPLAPGTKNPADTLPGFLKRKKDLPKPLQDLLDRQGSDQAAYDLYLKIKGETPNTGAAATGSDVPGGTVEEKQSAAMAAAAEKNRDSFQAAQAKVNAAKAAMDKITDHGSKEYLSAQQQYYAALNAQADLTQDTATAQARASLYPGDKVGAARIAVQDAENNVHRFAEGTKEYWDAVARLHQSQVDFAAAQREQASLIAQTHIDLTDPVAVANQALKDARRKLADDRKNPKVDKGTIAADQIDVTNKQNAAEDAAFRQRLSDAQTADQLGTISHAAYLRYLENESKRLHAIKHKTRQQIDEMNEVDKDIKEANKQLSGQFNLGDIKIPTVYEVRRSIQAQAAGMSANAITNSAVANNTTNNVTVNGADFARVTAWLQQIFGKTARVTTTPRKA